MKKNELLQENVLRSYAKPECNVLAFDSERMIATSFDMMKDNGTVTPDYDAFDAWGV